jgi:hypothetical protein
MGTQPWIGVASVALWVLAHIIGSLLIFILAPILANALSPTACHLERYVPRGFAIALVYIGILSTLSGLVHLIVITAVSQVAMLLKDVTGLLTPPPGVDSPLVDAPSPLASCCTSPRSSSPSSSWPSWQSLWPSSSTPLPKPWWIW